MSDTAPKNSVKYFLFVCCCLAALIAYLWISIKPFDKEAALQEYIAQDIPKNTTIQNTNSNEDNLLQHLAISNDNTIEIWQLIANKENSIYNYKININDTNNNILKVINLELFNNKAEKFDFYTLHQYIILIINNNYISIINKNSKVVSFNNIKLTEQYNELQSINNIKKNYLYPSISLYNENGKSFLFFPNENLLLTPDQFQQQKQNAKNNSSWSFSKQYYVYNQSLYLITQKKMPSIFTKPISKDDMLILLKDKNNWLWNALQVVDIKKINTLKEIDNNAIYLYSDNNFTLIYNNNFVYNYNTKGKLIWKTQNSVFSHFNLENNYINTNIISTNYTYIIQNGKIILLINKTDGKIVKQIEL